MGSRFRDGFARDCLLQRGVCCELRSSQARPASRANLTSLDYIALADGRVITYAPIFVSESKQPGAVLAITRDLTEYMQASEALQQAQADLARLNRVMLLEEMAASIAHEVNQPISAVITNANAGLRWLGARQPDPDEVRQALGRIVRDGTRAGEVISRIRALVKKTPPRRERLDINQTIREVVALTQTEMQRNGVTLQSRLSNELPIVSADRVQLQR